MDDTSMLDGMIRQKIMDEVMCAEVRVGTMTDPDVIRETTVEVTNAYFDYSGTLIVEITEIS